MKSQPGSQTITIHILPNISRIKGNQKMKFGQLIQWSKRNILLAENKAGRLVPDPFVFKKVIKGKSKWSAACFHYIPIALTLAYSKNKL